MSLEYSLKHWRHKFNPYLRMIPWLLEQARLEWEKLKNHFVEHGKMQVRTFFSQFCLIEGVVGKLQLTLTSDVILDRNFLDEHTKRERNPYFLNGFNHNLWISRKSLRERERIARGKETTRVSWDRSKMMKSMLNYFLWFLKCGSYTFTVFQKKWWLHD